MRIAMPAAVIVGCLVLAGCSFQVDEAPPIPSTSAAPVVPSPSPSTSAAQLPLSGELVSQGAETSGTVTISATSETEFTITLSQFATGDGDDLRIWLSEGELTLGEDGFYAVDGEAHLELSGRIDPSASEQSFVFPVAALAGWDIRSFTVYDYANRTAFGSAALG